MHSPRRAALLATAAGGLALAVVVGLTATPAVARPWPGHPGRHLITHRVQPGDTATGLAVRYHAWTAELLRINHLRRHSVIHVGERLVIPVVDAAARRARKHHKRHHHASHHAKRHHAKRHHARHHRHHATHHAKRHHASHHAKRHHVRHHRTHAERMRAHGWRHYRMSRDRVRRLIVRTASRHDVPPSLALAVAWQESGWYQPVVSPAGAVGVMQLLPSTGDWMSLYAGRDLNVRDTVDNVTGGVLLLSVLRAETRRDRHAIAAYYQGLGAVREHGLYPSTKTYVRSVRAIQHRLRAGLDP